MRSLALCLALSLAFIQTAAAADPPGSVRLTLEQYEALMRAARQGPGAASWSRASVHVTLPTEGSEVVTVQLDARVKALGESATDVPVLPGDVVLEHIQINGSTTQLRSRGGMWVANLHPNQGEANVSIRYLVKLRDAEDGRASVIPLPPVPGSTFTVDTGGSAVDIQPHGKLTKSGDRITAQVAGASAVVIRVDEAHRGLRVRRADYAIRVDDAGEGADVTVTLDVFSPKAGREVRIAPESVALTNATDGKDPLVTAVKDGWHVARVSSVGRQKVIASFRMLVDRSQGQPNVSLTMNEWPIANVVADIPGKRAIEFAPKVPLTTTFLEPGRTKAEGFLPPTDELVLSWTEERPEPEKIVRINSETYQLVSISEGVLRSKVHVRYEILRGKTKELNIEIPESIVLYKVTGGQVEDWRTFAATTDAPRQVQITLSQEVQGTYSLVLELEQVISKQAGSALNVPVVRPRGAFRETGVVALFGGKKVGFEAAKQTGYTPVGQDALPSDIRAALTGNASQAFKHIGEPKNITSKVTEVKEKDILYDAQVFALYSVKEGAILANATVQVEVKSGRSERLVLTFPEDVTILSVIAPSVSKKGVLEDFDAGEGRKAYELRFSQPLEGTIEAHLEYELVPKIKGGTLRLPDLRVSGAEVEEGSFGITAETGIEVKQARADALRKVDAAELPDSVRKRAVGAAEILLGYQYAHAPWELDLDIKRHETVQTLTAAVTAAWLETTVFEDGHIVTRAVLNVKNEDRQFLRLSLPANSKVWTVSYDNLPVKAVSDESGALAIPLRKGKTAMVEVVYEQGRDPLGNYGSLDFEGPKTDVLVTDLHWLVRMPKTFALHSIDTSMQEADAADYAPGFTVASALPIAAPPARDLRMLLFKLPVNDASEPAPKLSVSYVTRPSKDLGQFAWILGLVLLIVVAFRRAAGKKTGVAGWAMVVLGLGCFAAKSMVFGVDDTELWTAVGFLVAAAVAGLVVGFKRRTEQAGSN